ncbi:MAG TPA: hypothetical protein VIL07_03360 [Symbiobacteriaceae bacterium]
MGPLFLFVTGAVITLLSLWQLRRWLAAIREAPHVTPKMPPAPPSSLPRHDSSAPKGRKGLAALEREVAELAEAGLTVTEIAQRVGLTRAEVQLILGLRSPR